VSSQKITDFVFSDLYLTTGSENIPFAKGLREKKNIFKGSPGGVTPIPEALLEDVRRLSDEIESHYLLHNRMREFTISFHDVKYRCSLIAAPGGEHATINPAAGDAPALNWCIRHLNSAVPNLTEIRMPLHIQKEIMEARHERGLILVSGSFGSGKTTTASSILDDWVRTEKEVGVTLEDPPEMPLFRVTGDQGAIYQIDLTDKPIHTAIKHARRWSPRYVFLGEIRTPEAAVEMLQMAISGPLVICTIHASDPIMSLIALSRFASSQIQERVSNEMIASSIKMVLHQEMIKGRPSMKLVRFDGKQNYGMRAKIENGFYQKIYEDIHRQQINKRRELANM
jgi:twitching motility protein PilT